MWSIDHKSNECELVCPGNTRTQKERRQCKSEPLPAWGLSGEKFGLVVNVVTLTQGIYDPPYVVINAIAALAIWVYIFRHILRKEGFAGIE